MAAEVEWVVWYDDGSSVTSLEAEPHDVPRWGVIVVASYERDHGRVLWWNGDYYFREHDAWMRCDLAGLLDYITRPGREKVVLVGRSVPYQRFLALYRMAVDDPRLPPKSSYTMLEPQLPADEPPEQL